MGFLEFLRCFRVRVFEGLEGFLGFWDFGSLGVFGSGYS